MLIICSIVAFVALVVFIDLKQQKESGVAKESATLKQAAAIAVIVAAFLAYALSGASGGSSGSNWDSMSEQEKENARYAYETKKWMDENGY